jgi:hypothetical protein
LIIVKAAGFVAPGRNCFHLKEIHMKGDQKVIERLNEALFLELGAVNQYWLHYRLLEDWGYQKLAKKERAESIEEMQHADKIVARIIFLEGHPNLQTVSPLRIGQNVKEVLLRSRRLRDHAAFRKPAGRRGRPYRLPRNPARASRQDR